MDEKNIKADNIRKTETKLKLKFTLDNDSSLNAEYDLPVNTEDVGEACFEIGLRMAQIIDEAYPEFMKAIWS